MPSLAKLALAATISATGALAASAVQLLNFTTVVSIENSVVRPEGQLLIGTFTNGSIYSLNTTTSSAALVAQIPGGNAVWGLTAVGYDTYAVVGGTRVELGVAVNQSIYTVHFHGGEETAVVRAAAALPDAMLANGIEAAPGRPSVVLVADSRAGCIWRVNTESGNVTKALTGDLLAPPVDPALTQTGVNGLKFFDGYLYFTNSQRKFLGRVAMSEKGLFEGEPEVVFAMSEEQVAAGAYFDDFTIDDEGVVYTTERNFGVARIFPNGSYELLYNDTLNNGPTSVQINPEDSTKLWVTTRGGTTDSGRVLEVQL